MDPHHAEIIIIKRKSNHEEGHHGGAWKIAFADFMTAMMAFFLVLWIINATDKDTKTVIARYFNPVKLENPGRAKKGVHGVESKTKSSSDETDGAQNPGAPTPTATPGTNKDSKESKESKESKDAKASAESAAEPTLTAKDEKAKGAGARPDPPEPVDVKPTVTETALFSDPYQSLDRIAGGRAAMSPAAAPDTGSANPTREAGATSVDVFRDPFKPIGPGATKDPVSFESDSRPPPLPSQAADLEPEKAPETQTPGTAPTPALAPTERQDVKSDFGPNPSHPMATSQPAGENTAGKPSDSSSPQLDDVATKLLEDLQQKLGALANSPSSPAINVKATGEGVLISLTDRMTFSMFAVGSAEPRPAVVDAMGLIAQTLKDRPGQIILRGHTDGRPYKSATYDNWRLSSARAQMAYYMLIRGGVPETRIDRVEGHADRALRDAAHPLAAENRRLEILLREPKP